MSDLREAALTLVRAYDAYVDAVNGSGHPGTEHDRAIHMDPCTSDPAMHIYSTSTDCAACGGAAYGTEADIQTAIVATKRALGVPLRPYEEFNHPLVEAPA